MTTGTSTFKEKKSSSRANSRRHGLTLIEGLIVFGIILALISLMLPSVRSARESARRNQCLSQTKQIMLALLNYEQEYGTLPPAYTVDADGNRLHSWRTLILPYIEEQALYDSIDLTVPWDDPANAHARVEIIEVYQCPSTMIEGPVTTYLAIVGDGFVFSGATGLPFEAVTDATSETVAVIDVPAEHAVPWMSPNDADKALVSSLLAEEAGIHPSVTVMGFVDGHAASIDNTISQKLLMAMLTFAGGESTDDD